MRETNRVELTGRITQDLTLRTPKEGFTVLDISFATNTAYKDKQTGEKKSITDFHNLSADGKLAELIAKHAKKGDPLYIVGSLKTQSWEKDGVKHYKTFVKLREVDFLKWYGEKKAESTTTETDTSDDVSIGQVPW